MATSRERSDEGVADPEMSGAPAHVGEPIEGGGALEGGVVEPRILAAWRQWLGALATDAEAAIAAAHVYGELAPEARDAWLDALREDEPKLDVPKVAIYAPLLAVEADPARRERIEQAIGGSLEEPSELRDVRALRGIADDGARVVALVSPLYLSFVRVLFCRYHADEGFVWVRHDPILGEKDAPSDGAIVDNVVLEATPLNPVIEELAHAVLAQGRRGIEMPRSLHLFTHLFDAHVVEEDSPP
jgi:hypothetical protein